MDGATELESWRDRLAIRLARFFSWVMVGAGLFFLGLGEGHARFTVAAISVAGGLLVLLLNASGRFRGRTVSAGIVSVAFVGSMGGYVSVGAVPGPAVAIATTLMLAGLLLGRKVMFVLIALAAVSVSLIGVGILEGWLPEPPARPLSSHLAWFRTTVVSFLIIGLVAHIITAVIDQIEKGLREAEDERVRSAQSERRRAEAERKALEARHLEVMGRLVSGVAHDFNNNLTTIIGLSELLKTELPEAGSQREILDDILAASLRSADLTKQLLAYARKGRVQPAATKLEPLLRSCIALVRHSLDPIVEVVMEFDVGDATVSADPALLQNALLNLLLNARDAMPNGGRLTIRATVEECAPSSNRDDDAQEPSAMHKQGVLCIEDTGNGIPLEVVPRIFEPFFTTKPQGSGQAAGLSLSAVSGTIRSHGGSIDVESVVGRGTTFTVRLPLIDTTEELLPEAQQSPLRGTGELLVVDDDARVRHAAAALLTALGYTVTLAENGDHALEIVRNTESRFDLVLLDLRMPGQSGEVTLERLREACPDVPVLLWSGRAADGNLDGLLNEDSVRYVQKPYRAAELAKHVAELIAVGKERESAKQAKALHHPS